MRSLWIVLLLVLMPLQFSWAATAVYFECEIVASTAHVSHHVERHGSRGDATNTSDPVQAALVDGDCGTCHTGCFVTASNADKCVSLPASMVMSHTGVAHPTSAPLKLPERPQWLA